MRKLLVLGSKPTPTVPSTTKFDDVACANASSYSARKHQLPAPTFTVLSSFITARADPKCVLALEVLSGSTTGTVYFYPRSKSNRFSKRIKQQFQHFQNNSLIARYILHKYRYSYDEFVCLSRTRILNYIAMQCDYETDVLKALANEGPSTGLLALFVGISLGKYDKFILAGFGFSTLRAYENENSDRPSRHTMTDICILRHLANKSQKLYTTETIVFKTTGIPLI